MSAPGLNSQGQGQGAGGFEPGFDENAPELSKEPLDLSRAREPFEKFHMPGNFFWIADATSTGSLITVTFNRDEIPENLPFGKGMYVKGLGIEDVKISHPAQAEEMTIVFGNVGPTQFDVGNLNEGINQLQISEAIPSPGEFHWHSEVDITNAETISNLLDFTADFNEIIVSNQHESDNHILIQGTQTSNQGGGITVYPGGNFTLDWDGTFTDRGGPEPQIRNDQNSTCTVSIATIGGSP